MVEGRSESGDRLTQSCNANTAQLLCVGVGGYAPRVALDLIAELAGILAALERDGVDYALCGGIALAIYKRPRFTDDIDILVLPTGLSAALASARSVGFDIPARKMIFGPASGAKRRSSASRSSIRKPVS